MEFSSAARLLPRADRVCNLSAEEGVPGMLARRSGLAPTLADWDDDRGVPDVPRDVDAYSFAIDCDESVVLTLRGYSNAEIGRTPHARADRRQSAARRLPQTAGAVSERAHRARSTPGAEMTGDPIAILEAAYDLTGSEDEWLRRLVEVASSSLDDGHGLMGFTFDVNPSEAVNIYAVTSLRTKMESAG
jgi:hypothetical protein